MADLHVGSGQSYSTIAAAVHVSNNNDNIVIHNGTYYEVVNLTGSLGLTITSSPGDTVVIDGSASINNNFYITKNNITISYLTCGNPAQSNITPIGSSNLLLSHLYVFNSSSLSAWPLVGYASNAYITASDCVFSGANGSIGSGIYISSLGDMRVQRCRFYSSGMGVYLSNTGSIIIDACQFVSCSTGIQVQNVTQGVTASSCVFQNCINGIYNVFADKRAEIYNSTFVRCTTGLYVFKYLSAIENNVFTSCSTGIAGDGGGDQTNPGYNIFNGNTANISNYNTGTTNFSANPAFVNYGADNYQLLSVSPAIGASNPLTPTWITTDFLAHPRGPGTIDIGAYEYYIGGYSPFVQGMQAAIFNGNIVFNMLDGSIINKMQH